MKLFIGIIPFCRLSHHCGLNYSTDIVEKYELCILDMLCEKIMFKTLDKEEQDVLHTQNK